MKRPVYEALMALLKETEALLRCPEPATSDLKEYSRRRSNVFVRLRSLDSLDQEQKKDRAGLDALLRAVLESDRRLISKLKGHMNRCRKELSELASQKQALKGYAWASRHSSPVSRCRV